MWYRESQAVFNKKMENLGKMFKNILQQYKNILAHYRENEKREINSYIDYFITKYNEKNNIVGTLKKGMPSPAFNDCKNYDGTTTSLSDLKGKYIYIDLWATWCGPCKEQFPYLNALEEKYHDKNIVFVSISIDRPSHFGKWKNMVKKEGLKGVQLFSNTDFQTSFQIPYKVTTIPRFIVIDPDGNIVAYNAPKPSEKRKTEALFATLGL